MIRQRALLIILFSTGAAWGFVVLSVPRPFSNRNAMRRIRPNSTFCKLERIKRRSHRECSTDTSLLIELNDYMDLSCDDFPQLEPLWSDLLGRFQGDFDNYNQVIEDRKQHKLPREGGGHEHIHCTLVPLTNNTRLAAFYFDGTPQAIFRFRFYQLIPACLVNKDADDKTVYTILYTLDTTLEGRLRARSQTPLEWPQIYSEHATSDSLSLLPKCEVQWSFNLDRVLHAYAAKEEPNAIHAIMVHGQALVQSQMTPGQEILIKDQLSLWDNALWIHDRGFDPQTMEFIYGNRENVPYRMERVSEFCMDEQGNLVRQTTRDDLEWTLGPSHRTEEVYKAKVANMGGPSIPPRPQK